MSPDSKPLAGRVALVAGASRGIGADVAKYLARAGASVVVAARSTEVRDPRWPVTIYDVAREIEEEGGTAFAVRLDMRYPESIAECVQESVAHFGRLDIVVNNAAVQARGNIETMEPKYLDLMYSVNVRGPILMCREALPHLRRAGGGHIINVSSRGALMLGAGPYSEEPRRPTSYFYGPTKAALDRFTQELARDIQPDNISVNCLSPDHQVTTPGVALLRNIDNPDAALLDVEIADALGKAAVWICQQPPRQYTGNILYDEEVARDQRL